MYSLKYTFSFNYLNNTLYIHQWNSKNSFILQFKELSHTKWTQMQQKIDFLEKKLNMLTATNLLELCKFYTYLYVMWFRRSVSISLSVKNSYIGKTV